MMKHIALIANLTAGKKKRRDLLQQVIRRLENLGMEITFKPTEYAGHAALLAREAVEKGMDGVAVFGGDGSLREVGEVLADSGTPMLVLPAGTSNVLARSLGIPLDPLAAVDLVERGKPRPVDVGQAGDARFLFMCGAGMDAEVMAAASIPFKKRLGRASFYPALMRLLFTYRFPLIRLETEGDVHEGNYAAIMNIPHYAGDYRLCPPARWDDGKLDALIFRIRGRGHLFRLFLRLRRGTIMDDPSVTHVVGREFRLSSDAPVRYQLDGDTMGSLPVTVTLMPGALTIFS